MKITKAAVAGTLESSDAQVRIQPFDSLDIEINSSVAKQFGEQIDATVRAVLNKLNITAAQVIIEDKGALDCVLQARVKAAVLRATDENINWEAVL
ncbi:citrate lyase acyl carrier protein [Aggregatibacter actinomycetemcomitans]|uniref:citrate lyase acyl carrier protein n=1 Tax=Aggregatibacter actinomycetemcomitans TaxID=714 RepID=UPI00022AE3D3|nr:citrate lyase acyl carrier protein [Aggregatibacter actinomycetemcomitans]KOE57620.1 citrate lyase subunit gamma [Aggregatibacter actinomycetemcomitans serotype c str. SCC2302]KOE61247.1 citrate lyase subunit gamma [Aggregatibacter actinomycetemcomitans serotype c str. AAS4A]QEH45106.1 citrate lyase acyl carrier protein [Aggregatibacter actinomycetemcomitans]QEH47132.1 citrate lyase acyl carrier protein [Aggregatibacter actinomycetemcomitans]QEH49109.1 citrate lyase acyl carrier protein [Ag